jgi:hypothetical protein
VYKSLMFNEELLAGEIYSNGFVNKVYDFGEGVLVAKYLRHILGYGDAKIKSSLIEFCEKNDVFFNTILSMKKIRLSVTKSKKPFVNKSNPIPVCQEEIDVINGVKGYKQKRVLFAILVLAKKESNGLLYLNSWNNIRHVLHCKTTNKEILSLMELYYSLGLMQVGEYYHKPTFINRESPAITTISSKDIYSLNLVFEKLFGRDLFVCVDCHGEFEKKSYNQKRCKPCSLKKEKADWLVRQKRHREKMSRWQVTQG